MAGVAADALACARLSFTLPTEGVGAQAPTSRLVAVGVGGSNLRYDGKKLAPMQLGHDDLPLFGRASATNKPDPVTPTGGDSDGHDD